MQNLITKFVVVVVAVFGMAFLFLAVCGSSLLWRFLTVGAVGWVACQGFLVREACVGVLVGGAGFLLSPFKDNGLLFWVPDVLRQHSEVVWWNLLSVQMFF